MAYSRRTAGGVGLRGTILLQADGKFAWNLKEAFTSDDLSGSSTGSGSLDGSVILASGSGVADYDTAAAALKAAWTAAG